MEKRKATRTKVNLPVQVTILGREYSGTVRNYSLDGAFIGLPKNDHVDLGDVLHKDICFAIDEETKHVVKAKGKIVRIFSTENGPFLAVRFLDYMNSRGFSASCDGDASP
jgi:hypothetical protein